MARPMVFIDPLGRRAVVFLGCVDIGDCDTWARDWAMEEPDQPITFLVRYVQGRICN